MFSLHLIRPAWLLALPLCVLLPWAWRRWRRPSGDWGRVCDPHLLRWLSVGGQDAGGGRWGPWWAGLAMAVAVLALSGPSWQRLPDTGFSARDARVIALDLSLSMLAQDLKPDRLTRARFRLSDLLEETREGQVGMVAFAGDAYVVTPLTADTNTIANMLPALRPDVMPVSGSRADRALALAAELLERSGLGRGEILLVTDEADARTADKAADLLAGGIVTSVLGAGTEEGAPIPSGNGFVGDGEGNVVIARLDTASLRAVAEAGGGRYSTLATSVDRSPWREGEGLAFSRRDDGLGERWKDAGPWLVLLLLPLVAVGFRRGLLFGLPWGTWPAVLVPALLSAPTPAGAGIWDDLWQRPDQQAHEALEEGRPAEAAVLARDPVIAGEARYRGGDYPGAVQSYSMASPSADAHYNRGNALAHAGRLDEAVAAYDQALALDPDMEDALYNKSLVEQARQQQSESSSGEGEQQQGEPQASDQSGEQGEQQQDGEGEQDGELPPDETGEGDREGRPGEEAMARAWSEEDEQAMEQWLRRIPDDPGGLLRRKFRSEHQRRGAPPDEGDTW